MVVVGGGRGLVCVYVCMCVCVLGGGGDRWMQNGGGVSLCEGGWVGRWEGREHEWMGEVYMQYSAHSKIHT